MVDFKRKLAAQFDFMEPYTNYKSAAAQPCGDGHRYRTHQNATPVPVSVSVVVLPSVMTSYNGKMGYLLTLCLLKFVLFIFAKSNRSIDQMKMLLFLSLLLLMCYLCYSSARTIPHRNCSNASDR